MKLLIIGVDPGLNSAVAALDLKGRHVSHASKRGWTPSGLKKAITEMGKPLFVAVDRADAPEAARKLAASFNCELFCPKKDLTISEKEKLVAELPLEGLNDHEADALAAALAAWKSVAGQFNKIDANLEAISMEEKADDVKEMIFTGRAKNMSEALEKLVPKEKVEVKHKIREWDGKTLVKRLEKNLEIRDLYIKKLETKVKSLEKHKAEIEEEKIRRNRTDKAKVFRDKEVSFRDNMISQLRGDVEKEKAKRETLEKKSVVSDEKSDIEADGFVPVVPVRQFNRPELSAADGEFRVKGNAIWIEGWSESEAATTFLIALGPSVVIGRPPEKVRERLLSAGLALADAEPSRGKRWAFVKRGELEEALKAGLKKGIAGWLKEYRQRDI